jgi:hypothetical protein
MHGTLSPDSSRTDAALNSVFENLISFQHGIRTHSCTVVIQRQALPYKHAVRLTLECCPPNYEHAIAPCDDRILSSRPRHRYWIEIV